MIAICDDWWLLQGFPSAAVQAKRFAVSFVDVAKKVKNAAGAYRVHTFIVQSFAWLRVVARPVARSLAKHSEEIWDGLIDLFENPSADADCESRELLSAVLGKPDLQFAKPIFNLVYNPHLRPLVLEGVLPCVCEDKALHRKGLRSVLTIVPAATKGQELLFDFFGTYTYNVYTQYV